VADASVFPTASGVNPMLSIMGLAHRAAARIATRVG
jgi:choline dehydrogenase-like flavoprotein